MTYDDAKDWIFENLPDYVPPDPMADFAKFVLPVIRDFAAPPLDLIAALVAVQPMELPAANVFYLDFEKPSLFKPG